MHHEYYAESRKAQHFLLFILTWEHMGHCLLNHPDSHVASGWSETGNQQTSLLSKIVKCKICMYIMPIYYVNRLIAA